MRERLARFLACAAALALATPARAADVTDRVAVSGIELVATTRLSRTLFEFEYRITLASSGGAIADVVATLVGVGSGTQIADGVVFAGALGAGASVIPSDTIRIRQDRTIAFEPGAFVWSIEGEPEPISIELVPRMPYFDLGQPIDVDVVVRNDGDAACRIAAAPFSLLLGLQGPDGRPIAPALSRAQLANGLRDAIEGTLVEIPAAGTVTLPLRGAQTAAGGAAIRSVSGVDDASVLDALWPFDAEGTYRLTATLRSLPLPDATDLCVGAATGETRIPVPEPGASGAIVAIAAVLAALASRRRRARAGACALALVAAIAPQRAGATLSVDPALQSEFDRCVASFAASGVDTSSIDVLGSSEKSYSVGPSTIGSSSSNDSGFLYWDPNDTHDLGGGVAAEACCALYHELAHLREVDENGETDKSSCFVNGVDTEVRNSEVDATRAENECRTASGLPQRSSYGGKSLPPPGSECEDEPPPPPPPAPEPCEGSCGQSWGDPHLTTLDGLDYDFQAAGEFVLVQSTQDDLRIQVRQRAWGPASLVAVNVAVAARVHGATVAIEKRAAATRVVIDGAEVSLPPGVTPLGGAGQIERSDGVFVLRWEDGSTLEVAPGLVALDVRAALDASRAGALVGLLGDADGDPANDLRTRGGEAIGAPPYTREALYDRFGASWRISNAESLFPYAPGESTATFTDLSFPRELVAREDLAGTETAEALCRERGVALAAPLAACVIDLTLTGEPTFADGAADAQTLLGDAVFAAKLGDRLASAVAPFARHIHAFDAVAGTPIALTSETPAANGASWSLLGPDGAVLGGPLLLSSDLGDFTLPAAGTYQIVIAGGATGAPYSVDLLTRAPASSIGASFDTTAAGDLVAGGRVTYGLFVTGRHLVYLRSESAPEDARRWRVEAPTGRVTAEGALGADLGRIELAERGTHRVVIEDPAGTGGAYGFTPISAGDDVTFDYGVLPTSSAGSIPPAGKLIQLFSETAGSTLTFRTGVAAVDGRRWWLEREDGTRLVSERGLWVDLGPVTLPADEKYALVIGAIDESGGSFSWSVEIH